MLVGSVFSTSKSSDIDILYFVFKGAHFPQPRNQTNLRARVVFALVYASCPPTVKKDFQQTWPMRANRNRCSDKRWV